MLKIGVFGGTFDPVHNEHIAMAKAVTEELQLDKLIIMPTHIPPHKSHSECAPATDRLNMCRIAFDGENTEVSSYEIDEGGLSYTYKTLEKISSEYPKAKIYFIVGGDMLADFKHWRYPERILNVATLCAFKREGFNANFTEEKEYLLNTYGKTFITLNYVGKNISSTKIRIYKAFGLPVEGLISESVNKYIDSHNLYNGGFETEEVKRLLKPTRVVHTANVVIKALDKAKPLGLDRDKVFTACALHDIAKYLNVEDYKNANIDSDIPSPVVHAFLGAYYIENVLGIKDSEIINAVRYHTSGRTNMGTLEKLVFVADMIEDGRDYEGVEKLRELYDIDFEACFKACLSEETLHLKNRGGDIYKETVNAYNFYVKGEN